MTFLAVMAVIVLVLLGAIGVLAASATGRFDPKGEPAAIDAADPEAPWHILSLVAGALLALMAFVAFLLSRDVAWLGSLGVGALYVYSGAQGLRG